MGLLLLLAVAGIDAPPPPARFALLICGHLADLRSSSSARIQSNMTNLALPRASARLIRYVTASHMQNIVEANAARGRVDVFAHTWNPEAATYIDASYGSALRLSAHQPLETAVKGKSHALSVGRGALLVRAHERQRGVDYDSVLVIRADLFVLAPVDLRHLAGGQIYLAATCCARAPVDEAERKALHDQCEARGRTVRKHDGIMSQPCAVHFYLPPTPGRPRAVDQSYFWHDFWFAAPARIVATWLDIALRWDMYSCVMRQLGIESPWSHFRWSVHVHDGLNLTHLVRFSVGLHAMIARLAYKAGKSLARGPCTYAGLQPVRYDGQTYDVARILATPAPVRVAEALGYTARFAPMVRQCPFTQAALERKEQGLAPIAQCSDPVGGADRDLNGVPLCAGQPKRHQLANLPDGPIALWHDAPRSHAHVQGMAVLAQGLQAHLARAAGTSTVAPPPAFAHCRRHRPRKRLGRNGA